MQTFQTKGSDFKVLIECHALKFIQVYLFVLGRKRTLDKHLIIFCHDPKFFFQVFIFCEYLKYRVASLRVDFNLYFIVFIFFAFFTVDFIFLENGRVRVFCIRGVKKLCHDPNIE